MNNLKVLLILVLSIILAGCNTKSRDEVLSAKIVGNWSVEYSKPKAYG